MKTKSLAVAALVLYLTLCGGMQLYISIPVLTSFLSLTLFTLPALAGYCYFKRRVVRPAALYPLFIFFFSALISGLANLDIANILFGRLYLGAMALLMIICAACWLTDDDIMTGLVWAGYAWPLLFTVAWLLGWFDHYNILAFYPLVFLLVGLLKGDKPMVASYILFLAAFACRGAIVAAGVGAAWLLWPYWRRHWRVYGLLSLAGLGVLAAWKWGSGLERLRYWQAALSAWPASPWFGVGPLGLVARHIIQEGEGWQLHAHNILITTLAETGLIGLLALLAAAAGLLNMRYNRLQAALGLGLAAWSMVDEPLFWAGPLFTCAVIFSSLTWHYKTPKNKVR